MVAWFYLLWTITWLLAMVMRQQKNDDGKNYTSIAGHIDCPGNAPGAMRCASTDRGDSVLHDYVMVH
jgi:hypothetical protein